MPIPVTRESVIGQAHVARRTGVAAAVIGALYLFVGVIAGIIVATQKTGGESYGCSGDFSTPDTCPPVRHPYVSLGVSIAITAVVFGTLMIAIGAYIQMRSMRAALELEPQPVEVSRDAPRDPGKRAHSRKTFALRS